MKYLNSSYSRFILYFSQIAKWRSRKNTYGWARAEVLGALINAVFLIALCFTIFIEALQRMVKDDHIHQPDLMLIVGGIGLGINVIGLALFGTHSHSHGGHGHSHGGHGHSHFDDGAAKKDDGSDCTPPPPPLSICTLEIVFFAISHTFVPQNLVQKLLINASKLLM